VDQCISSNANGFWRGMFLSHHDRYPWSIRNRVRCLRPLVNWLAKPRRFAMGSLGWGPGIALFTVFGAMAD
jgi:hypothetical protein